MNIVAGANTLNVTMNLSSSQKKLMSMGYLHWNDWKAGAITSDFLLNCVNYMVTMNVQWDPGGSVLVGRGGNPIEPNYTNMMNRVKTYNAAHPSKPVHVIPYFYEDANTSSTTSLASIISGGHLSTLCSQLKTFLDTYRTSNYLMPDGSYIMSGIELDMEGGAGPSTNGQFVSALRSLLGSNYTISFTGNGYSASGAELTSASFGLVDWVDIMLYDMYFTGQSYNGYPQTDLAHCEAGVNMWASAGMPRSKILGGVPMYTSTVPVGGGVAWMYITAAYPNMAVTDRNFPWTSTLLSQAFGGYTYDTSYPPNDLSIQDVKDFANWILAGNAAGMMYFSMGYDSQNALSKEVIASAILLGSAPPANNPPVAAFSYLPSGLTAQFTDQSTGGPTSWSWNFGDGSALSTVQNPSHAYAAAGTYTVKLTATNAYGSNTYTATVTVSSTTYPYSVPVVISPAGAGTVTLTPATSGTGGGSVSGAGGTIGFTISEQVKPSQVANSGHTFQYWLLGTSTTHYPSLSSFTDDGRTLTAVYT